MLRDFTAVIPSVVFAWFNHHAEAFQKQVGFSDVTYPGRMNSPM
jgi:hypothetical protein